MNQLTETIKPILKKIICDIDLLFIVFSQLSYLRSIKLIKTAQENRNLKLNLGSGDRPINDWVNIDGRIHPKTLSMKMPVGLKKFDSGSANYIYTSHFLEHLEYPRKALDFVKECHRILVDGGTLRIVVPGIEKIIRAYVREDREFFKIQEKLHPEGCTTKLEHLMYALQQDNEHKYGYDFETMEKLLSQAGFKKIIKSDYNKSEVGELRIDYRGETDNTGESLSLYVEAIK